MTCAMLHLWYTHAFEDQEQSVLVHRQVCEAAAALSILHCPESPAVRFFAAWREIQSELDEAAPEAPSFVYVLAFGALSTKQPGELRVGQLLLNRKALESFVTKPNVHVHIVCDPTLDMATLPTEKAISNSLSGIMCGPVTTVATVSKGSRPIATAPQFRTTSYYSPMMPRFTEIYFRSMVEAVYSNDEFGALVNEGLEAAHAAAVQLKLRYEPETMQLLQCPTGGGHNFEL